MSVSLSINSFTERQIDWVKMAKSITGNSDTANDLVQEMYVKLLEIEKREGSLNRLSYNGEPNTFFVFTILRNLHIDSKRITKGKTYLPIAETLNVLTDDVNEQIEDVEKMLVKHDKVCDALTRLCFEGDDTDKYHLSHFINTVMENKPVSRYAKELGVTSATITNSINKIKKHLKNEVMGRPKGSKNTKTKTRKPPQKKKGVGDKVEDVLNSKMMKPITEAVKKALWKDGEDCGCEQRKEKLNKLFESQKKPVCMNEAQFKTWALFKERQKPNQLQRSDILLVDRMYADIFKVPYRATRVTIGCASCGRAMKRKIESIDKVFNTYETPENER